MPFGDAVGVGVQCLDLGRWTAGYWSVVRARIVPGPAYLPPSLSVALLDDVPIRIAPTQTRIIPIRLHIHSLERIPKDVKELDFELTCVSFTVWCQPTTDQAPYYTHDYARPATPNIFLLRVTLPLTHVPHWTQEKHVSIQASYFFAKSMPTVFLVKAPKEAFGDSQAVLERHHNIYTSKCRGNEPILALRKFNDRFDTIVMHATSMLI